MGYSSQSPASKVRCSSASRPEPSVRRGVRERALRRLRRRSSQAVSLPTPPLFRQFIEE